ncbi:MAG: histidinol-phosphate transaminase [Halioglobus sp.]
MSRYWSELVRNLTPYVPGEQPGSRPVIKLNTNENPYPPSPAVQRAVAGVSSETLRLYPDPQSSRLKDAIASRSGLSPEQVFVGNGSDEVLAFAFMALLKHKAPLYFPDITYSFYPVWADLCSIGYSEVPVKADLGIDVAAIPADNGGVILPNPNAPTGMLLPLEAIAGLLQRCRDSVVVIDEAYIDFGGESALALIEDYDNLLVVQTLSKSRSLAGLRVGVAMGNALLIEALDRVKNSFNSYPLDTLAQHAALAAIEDEDYFSATCARIVASREQLSERLKVLGFEVLPSSANFVFARHARRDAAELFQRLREEDILVRHFARERIQEFLRISIGTDAECDALIDALERILVSG